MMQITKRDRLVLKLLLDYGILTTKQIHALAFKSSDYSIALRRLRLIEKEKFINRVHGLPSGLASWLLTQKGASLVGGIPLLNRVNYNSLLHDVRLSTLRMELERQGIAKRWMTSFELNRLLGEKRARNLESVQVPDAVFSLRKDKEWISTALELELKRKSKDRYVKIFRNYKRSKTIDLVWYIVEDYRLGEFLEDLWAKTIGYGKCQFKWSYYHVGEDLEDPIETDCIERIALPAAHSWGTLSS